MNSGINLYNKKINNLKREIRNLKTAHFKTATTIKTMSSTTNITFSLYLDTNTNEIYGSERAIITLTTTDNSEMISACYINELNANLDDRYLRVQRITSDPGTIKYEIIIISYNQNDYTILGGGGSVNLNYTLTLVGSSKFTSSISYRSFFGGSS